MLESFAKSHEVTKKRPEKNTLRRADGLNLGYVY